MGSGAGAVSATNTSGAGVEGRAGSMLVMATMVRGRVSLLGEPRSTCARRDPISEVTRSARDGWAHSQVATASYPVQRRFPHVRRTTREFAMECHAEIPSVRFH